MSLNETGLVRAQGGGGGYPPGGYGPPGGGPPGGGGYPPGGGGYGPPGGAPPGGGGYPPGGGGYPPGGGGYGPPGGGPPGGGPPGGGGYGPPGAPPPGWGPPGGQPPGPSQYGGFVPPSYNGPQQPGGNVPPLDPVAAVAFGWNAVMKDFAAVAVPIVVALLVMVVPAAALNFTWSLMVGILTTKLDPTIATLLRVAGQCVTQVLSLGSQAFIFGGLIQFTLGVCRGQRPAFNVVFSGGRFFLPMLGGQLLYALALGVGFVMCMVPAGILACGFICYQPFIVDKGLGPIDALGASWRLTTGFKLNIFLYLLLSMAVGLLGVLALCVGAVLISWPVLAIANCYLYVKLIGEEPRAPA
ncbi:MAG: hypothetical protein ABI488_21180 [Polyangiaceae bacterium]